MNGFEPVRGSCLCGAVSFVIKQPVISMGHCHCSMCRRGHGTAYSTYCQVADDGLELESGSEMIEHYASSPGVTREFCGRCGGKLFYRTRAQPQYAWVAAGALDDEPGVEPAYHIFVDSRAAWHEITDDLPRYAEFPPDVDH